MYRAFTNTQYNTTCFAQIGGFRTVPLPSPYAHKHDVCFTVQYFYTTQTNTNRTAIIGGSAVPLLMFLAWNTVVLGSVDSAIVASATSSSGTFDPVQSLQGVGDYAAQLPQIVSVFSEVRNWLDWILCMCANSVHVCVCANATVVALHACILTQ
jgi:Tryptophan/tyrosine permease family